MFKNIHLWCDGSVDRSFIMDPLNYFSFLPVLHNWCNKDCGMCYPVYGKKEGNVLFNDALHTFNSYIW